MKTLTRILSLFLLAGLVIALTSAYKPSSLSDFSIGQNGNSCRILNEDGTGYTAGYLQLVVEGGDNQGVGIVRCTGMVTNTSGDLIRMSSSTNSNVGCFSTTLGQEANRWNQKIQPDGRTVLTCYFGSNF